MIGLSNETYTQEMNGQRLWNTILNTHVNINVNKVFIIFCQWFSVIVRGVPTILTLVQFISSKPETKPVMQVGRKQTFGGLLLPSLG